MEHNEWLERVTGGASARAIARTADLNHKTVTNQINRGYLSAENVMSIAAAYGHHPVGALVDTGYLDEKWAQQIDPTHAARALTDQQLCDEFLRRLKLPAPSPAFDRPIDELYPEGYPYLEMVANEDDEELGDDHDYTP